MRTPKGFRNFPFPRTGNKWESSKDLGENPRQGGTAVFVVCVCECVCDTASMNVWACVQVSVGWCACLMERVRDYVCECVCIRGSQRGRGVPSSLGTAFWKADHTTVRRLTFLRRSEPPS